MMIFKGWGGGGGGARMYSTRNGSEGFEKAYK